MSEIHSLSVKPLECTSNKNKKLKVLFLTPYFVPDYASSSPIYAALAEDLASMGHQVTVLTGMPYRGREKVWEEYKGRFLVKEMVSGYTVIRVYSYAASSTNISGKMFSWALFNILSALIGIKLDRHDVLFVANPFTMSGMPLHLLRRLWSPAVIYSVEDVYPDAAVQQGLLRANGAIAALVGWLEEGCYRRSSAIRVLSDGMRRQLLLRGVPEGKVVTIPNFADTDFVRPLPRLNSFRETYSLGDKFVVLYAGNMSPFHGLENVLVAAQQLRHEPDILFVLVGEGRAKPHLEAVAKRLALSNMRFIPLQPRESVPWVLASADVSLVALKSSFVHESVPGKFYWILASGRPVVASVSPQSEIAALVNRSQCGLCVNPDSPQALADAILRLRQDSYLRAAMGGCGRNFVVEHYSRKAITPAFDALIQSLVPAERAA